MRGKLLAALLGALTLSSLAAAGAAHVDGPQAAQAARAAMAYVGGRYASIVRPGAPGVAWQFRVVRRDGSSTNVLLDHNLALVDAGDSPSRATGFRPSAPAGRSRATQPRVKVRDADDDDEQRIRRADYDRASQAALRAVGGGRIRDVDIDHENGARYEVEVTTRDGRAVDVLLGADFRVIDLSAETDSRESAVRGSHR